MATGTVTWWNSEKGYGFARSSEVAEDVFLHFSELDLAGADQLNDGERIDFEIGQGTRGPVAVGIRAPGKAGPVLTMSNRAPKVVGELATAGMYLLPGGPHLEQVDCVVTDRSVRVGGEHWDLEFPFGGLQRVDILGGAGQVPQVVLTTSSLAVAVLFEHLDAARELAGMIADVRDS